MRFLKSLSTLLAMVGLFFLCGWLYGTVSEPTAVPSMKREILLAVGGFSMALAWMFA